MINGDDYYSKSRSNRSKLRIGMILCTLIDRTAALQPTYHAVLYVIQIGRTDCICLHSMSLYVQSTATILIENQHNKSIVPNTHISIRIHILRQNEKSDLFVYTTVKIFLWAALSAGSHRLLLVKPVGIKVFFFMRSISNILYMS